MSNDDEWDFKIDDKDAKPKQSKDGAKVKRPKRSIEEIAKDFAPQPEMELRLDHKSFIHRDERNQIVKRSIALEEFARIKPAPYGRRIKAIIFDFLYIVTLCGLSWLSFPYWRTEFEAALPPGLLGDIPNPQLVLEYSIPFFVYLTMYLLPTCFSRKSPGKKIFDLRIGNKEDDCGISKLAIFWREIIVKPISIVSVVGLLLVFINEKRRSLHDYLSGTTVYDEL